MALKNLADIETNLSDFIFSEDEITKYIKNRDNIFEIKNNEKSLGFISLADAKNYFLSHEDEAIHFFVKNIDRADWKTILDSSFFQRRKPQLVSTENADIEVDDELEFYILQNGQKVGPLTKAILMEMVSKKEILVTEMVSFNGGQVWLKLYQIDGFNRRASRKESDQLPGAPDTEMMSKQNVAVRNIGATVDAITSLAFLGNLKRGKSIEREREVFYNDEMTKKAKASSVYKWLLVASVLGIIYFLINIKFHLSSPFGIENNNTVGEQAEMLTPVEDMTRPNQNFRHQSTGINDLGRGEKMETRKLNPVRPANIPRQAPTPQKSFMDTQVYQDNANDTVPAAAEDNNYYYDNSSPMELDPVRSQVSKENFENPASEPAPPPESAPFDSEISN
jgi:hypothetical protein